MTTDTTPTPSVAATETPEKSPPSSNAPTMHFRMVALDLDGTLLNSKHQLSEKNKACLHRLHRQGFVVAIATGRGITTVYEVIKSLHLPKPIPVVCSNGAEGWLCSVVEDGQGGKTVEKEPLFSTPVPHVVAQRTIDLSTELGFLTQYYVGEEVFADPTEPHHYQLTELYIELTGSKTQYVKSFQEAMQKGLPSKQLVFCRVEEQDGMMEAYEKELAKEPYLINGKPATMIRGNLGWFMEVLHPEVCKGTGLENMCEHLKIPIDECIAFGDGDNDYEFLQMAGKGFAMKNAREVVKGIADEILQYTNDEDGVSKTLQKLEEQGCLVLSS